MNNNLYNNFQQQQDYYLITQYIVIGIILVLISKFLIFPQLESSNKNNNNNNNNNKMAGKELKVGDDAPDFSAVDKDGNTVSLKDFTDKILVFFFYPKDNTPGCTKEACSFRDNYQAFTDAGAEVVGISTDNSESHNKFATKFKLPFKLITDEKGEIAKTYGVKKTAFLIPGRTTFIIDKNQKIASVYTSLLNAESHISEALKVIETLKSQ